MTDRIEQVLYDFLNENLSDRPTSEVVKEFGKEIDALYNQPVTGLESCLLTDEELRSVYACQDLDSDGNCCADIADCTLCERRNVAKSQLAKAELIIRADERANVLKEIGEWLDKWRFQEENVGTDLVKFIDQFKQGKEVKP